jgi:heterodisulfide reductase subunit A2
METRAGVFLCNCGGAMKNIDFDAAASEIARITGVASVHQNSDLCLAAGRDRMTACIREENLDRVVVAACSPEFTEHPFRRAMESAGLNGHLLSTANIREQCSWAHKGDVTAKAVQLVKMAISRTRLLQPVEEREIDVERSVLVVGGGFSAINVGLLLSRAGLCVTLLESTGTLGNDGQELGSVHGFDMGSLVTAAEREQNIEVLTSASMVAVEGAIGDFTVTIAREGKSTARKCGAIVLATGSRRERALAPDSDVCTGGEGIGAVSVVSQDQLVERLDSPRSGVKPATLAFMMDFADESTRFPTLATLGNAVAARRAWDSEVYVFCRDLKVDSQGAERLYREARDCGVVFVKCPVGPRITSDNGRIMVEAKDVLLGEDISMAFDLLVPEPVLYPNAATTALGSLLGIRLDAKGFYQEENVHLYPVASERKGVFMVGTCRGQSDIGRVMNDISSAVISIRELLSPGKIVVESERVKVDPQKCVACLTCIRVCPHAAIQLIGTEGGKEKAVISDLACHACGICAAICPAKAIEFQDYRDDQILAQIEATG